MLDLGAVAERLAVCFASGRVDSQTSTAVQALFPKVETFSLSMLAGGKLLVTADNMLKSGSLSISFLRLDNTVAGEAMLTHNSCYTKRAALRDHNYVDAEKAMSGCANFTSVPILAVLQPNAAASGPLVQDGMAALGAISIGSCAPVSGRQLTQLMTLACLMSPFLSWYASGMVQDLTSFFLAPFLAESMLSLGQPTSLNDEPDDQRGAHGRVSCRDADARDPDANAWPLQSLTRSEREAEDLYAELMDLPGSFQVRESKTGGAGEGTIGQMLLDRGYPRAGSLYRTRRQSETQLAAGLDSLSGACSSSSNRLSFAEPQRGAAVATCGSGPT